MTNSLFEKLVKSISNWNILSCISFKLKVCLLILTTFLFSCSSIGSFFSPQGELDYSVRAGDTLYLIAKRYEVSMLELQNRNGISDPRKLRIGQILKIPIRGDSEHASSGGPYVSAEQARKQRQNVTFPAISSLGVRMSMPIEAARSGSPFGYRGSRFHEGVDLVAEEGTPIYSAHDGVVIFSGQKLSGYGNMVAVKQGQVMTVYAHNSINLVKRGDSVLRGDKIAEVGSTGRATGPHLHFEVRVRGDDNRYYAVEPRDFIKFKP